MSLPPVIEYLLEDMRRAITNQPEYLLKTTGGPTTSGGAHLFADFYGFDGELIRAGYRMLKPEPVWLMPIRPKLTAAWSGNLDPTPTTPTARYELQSCFAHVACAAEALPGLKVTDLQPGNLTELMLIRYKRTA